MEKLLSIFGLMKISNVRDLEKEPYTETELDSMYVVIAHERAKGFDRDKFETMVDLLKKNPDFMDFLDWTIDADVQRAFNVTDDERPIVRGAVSRTRYLRTLCLEKTDTRSVFNQKIKRVSRGA